MYFVGSVFHAIKQGTPMFVCLVCFFCHELMNLEGQGACVLDGISCVYCLFSPIYVECSIFSTVC